MCIRDSSQTVDFGIDLGTTNSAISRARGERFSIVKNSLDRDTTPSAVARTSVGQTLVGQDALNKPGLSIAQNFKRLMGTSTRTTLADGSEWLPEELSAEVLKDLKASALLRYDVEPEFVVVTVPAMFQQPQCEATHRAASLAGLTAVSLLQEPIAAAVAFLNDDPHDGNFLVYDLGGGTFDVSVVRVRANEMSVLAHGGDNFLGGSDLDRMIFDWAAEQIERRLGGQDGLTQLSNRDQLLKSCELAKIKLASQEETFLDLGDWLPELPQLSLKRSLLEDLAEEQIKRTLRLTGERLEEASLQPQDIDSIILVGGPTKMPVIRRRLREEFGIRLSMELDPMTVVAAGAAITAGSLLVPERTLSVPAGPLAATLDLFYDPISPDALTSLAGRVQQPADFTGDIRLSRKTGDWDTGWFPITDGAFSCNLSLNSGAATNFSVSLRDRMGTAWIADPAVVTIRYGMAIAAPVTPYDYGVALSDGEFAVVVARNTPLPAEGFDHQLHAAKTIPAGSEDELPIFFLEGNSPIAGDNIQVGEMRIKGTDLRRTLREGEQIEVHLHLDVSRLIKARVSIPALDLEFPVDLISVTKVAPTTDINKSLLEAGQLTDKIDAVVEPEDEVQLRAMRNEISLISLQLEMAQSGDSDVALSAVSKLASLKADLRKMESTYADEIAYASAHEALNRAEQITQRAGDERDSRNVMELQLTALSERKRGRVKGLEDIQKQANEIWRKHYWQTDEAWVSMVEWLREEHQRADDGLKFSEYLKLAEEGLQAKDYEAVRINAKRALTLVPPSDLEDSRFASAGLDR